MAILAPSLKNLRNEINLRWPNRDKTSDGWIGDPAHQKTVSDHNPNRRNIVNALDIDVDGVDMKLIIRQALKHPSTNYFIYNSTIWSRRFNFRPRIYTGSNKHIKHGHCSIMQTVLAEQNQTPWGLGRDNLMLPCRKGDKGQHVEFWQWMLVELGFDIGKSVDGKPMTDGIFGDKMEEALHKFRISVGSTKTSSITPWTAQRMFEEVMLRKIKSHENKPHASSHQLPTTFNVEGTLRTL